MSEPEKIVIRQRCVITREPFDVSVYFSDYEKWQNREVLAQEAFPYLTAEQREFLISGISPKGWEKIFSDGIDLTEDTK